MLRIQPVIAEKQKACPESGVVVEGARGAWNKVSTENDKRSFQPAVPVL
jgi:hypothetical protein